MKLSSIAESHEQPQDETFHDAEQAVLKLEVRDLPPGMVGFKMSSQPATGHITPNYVVAGMEGSGVVDYTHVGCFGGDYLLKVEIPVRPGEKTEADQDVMEWGSWCTYFAGNPVASATTRPVEPGSEVLILVPTKVLDVYKWAGGNVYRNESGETIKTI